MPAAWVGAATALYGATQGGGGGGGSGGGAMYTPYFLGNADTNWQGQMGAQQSLLGFDPYAQQGADLNSAYSQLSGINYQPYLQASQQAGQQYGNLASMAGQYGGQQYGQAMQDFGQQQALNQAGQQVYNLGFDPRQEQYNKGLQQTMDQSGAINSMYGLGSSGAGAGMEQQAVQNYNTDWQNQQLQRSLQGLQGLAGASQTGGQLGLAGNAGLQASLGYYGQQPGFTQQAAQTPITAQQYAYSQPFSNINQYAQGMQSAFSPYQQLQNQETQYMGLGSTMQGNAAQQALAQNKFNAQQYQQLGQSLGNVDWGSVGSGINSIFGGGSSGGTNYYGESGNGSNSYTSPTTGAQFNWSDF